MSDLDINVGSGNYSAFGERITFAGWVSLNFSVILRLVQKIFSYILFNASKNIDNYRIRDNKGAYFFEIRN